MPPVIIEAPPLSTPPFNLLAQVQVIDVDDERFVDGVEWVAEPNADGVTYNLRCGEGEANERQQIAVTGGPPTAGTFTLTFEGQTTAAIPFNATAAQVKAALEALSNVGPGNTLVTGGPFPGTAITIEFVAGRAGTNYAQMTATDTFTPGGDVAVSTLQNGAGGVAKPNVANRAALGAFAPFGVIAYDRCSTFSWRSAEYEARARRALAAVAPRAVEREWWTGERVATNERLAHTHATTVGTALGRRVALATLVQSLADNAAGTGVIHARPLLVQHWLQDGALEVRNNKLWTKNGHLVVQGAGYTGSSPAGAAPAGTVEWAYATSTLVVVRGPVMVVPGSIAEATDRPTNTVVYRAEQAFAIIGNHKAHLAVSVDTAVA